MSTSKLKRTFGSKRSLIHRLNDRRTCYTPRFSLLKIKTPSPLLLQQGQDTPENPLGPSLGLKLNLREKEVGGERERIYSEGREHSSLHKLSIKEFRGQKYNRLTKIGESTFSEIFKDREKNEIYKIIPLSDTPLDHDIPHTPVLSYVREVTVMKRLSGVRECIKIKDAYILRGEYPHALLEEWKRYRRSEGGENAIPSRCNTSLLFGVIVMEDGGEELEKFEFLNGAEIIKFFFELLRVILYLEKAYGFEHRDLHESNILLRRRGSGSGEVIGFKIIDFSISRVGSGSVQECGKGCGVMSYVSDRVLFFSINCQVIFSDLDSEENRWIFEGDEGVSVQYGVYKEMERRCGEGDCARCGRWKGMGESNGLWIGYLMGRVRDCKRYEGYRVRKVLDMAIECLGGRDAEGALQILQAA